MSAGSTFNVEAHHNSGDESFVFQYSGDGGATWHEMVVVTKTADNNTLQTFVLPTTLSGSTIMVRVLDTDRSAGKGTTDTIFVDRMFFQSST